LRPVVDRVERVEIGDPSWVGDRHEPVELPVVLDRQRDPLLVREAPEDVGGNRAAEVRVQLGQTLHGESLESGAALARRYVLAIALAIGVVVDVRIDLAGSRGVLFGGGAFALGPFSMLLRGELGLFRAPSSGLRFFA